MEFSKIFPNEPILEDYYEALALLQASDTTRIGHIDTGLTLHPALGFDPLDPTFVPENIHLSDGYDFLGGKPSAITEPKPRLPFVQCLAENWTTTRNAVVDCLSEYPDHGTKTLSVILSNNESLKGVAPGAQVIPVRIADGPVFESDAQRANLGKALKHLLGLPNPPRVISISMGNPGGSAWSVLTSALGAASPGLDRDTRRLLKQAHDRGVIVVCAAGQIIDRVVWPARSTYTIAVGGIMQDGLHHYPNVNYDNYRLVDIWAQASGVNRAVSFKRKASGEDVHVYAEDVGEDTPDDVSGTSYAAPQVAAAAALWLEKFRPELPAIDEPGCEKVVDAFRQALVKSAGPTKPLILGNGRVVNRPVLNVNRLMTTGPV